jgi:hypothetical protein
VNPSSTDLQTIQARLEKLEAQNRKLKLAGLAGLIILGAGIAMAQSAPTPKVIEAQRFVVKDAHGNVRAWLGVFGEGSELILGNSGKQPMMTLQVTERAGDLHFQGQENSGMNLGLDFGVPAISMAGSSGSGQATLRINDAGPSFSLRDSRGFSATVGVPETEPNGTTRSDKRSAASVRLFDKAGRILWSAPAR